MAARSTVGRRRGRGGWWRRRRTALLVPEPIILKAIRRRRRRRKSRWWGAVRRRRRRRRAVVVTSATLVGGRLPVRGRGVAKNLGVLLKGKIDAVGGMRQAEVGIDGVEEQRLSQGHGQRAGHVGVRGAARADALQDQHGDGSGDCCDGDGCAPGQRRDLLAVGLAGSARLAAIVRHEEVPVGK